MRVGSYQRGRHEHGTRIVVGGLRHGAYGLTMRAEGVSSSIEKAFGEKEFEIGDEHFDAAAYLQGAPTLIRAIFDAETRRATAAFLGGRVRVGTPGAGEQTLAVRTSLSDSELRVEIRERLFMSLRSVLPAVVREAVGLGQRLARPDDLAGRLADNTRREPVAAVRLANVQVLAREFATHPRTRETLLAALQDDSQAVRLEAAIALGPDGREALAGLAIRDETPDRIASRAILALGADFPPAQALARLQHALQADRPAVARACIGIIGPIGSPEGTGALAGVLAGANAELAVAAAQALGAGTGADAAAERALVEALGHESSAVRVAAADALGRIGTPLAVVPLRNCGGGRIFEGDVGRAARQAIAAIQARVTGASPGQLSLAAGEAGQISLVDEDVRGRVSIEEAAEPADVKPSDAARRSAAATDNLRH
jgi:HEAT repeat protein